MLEALARWLEFEASSQLVWDVKRAAYVDPDGGALPRYTLTGYLDGLRFDCQQISQDLAADLTDGRITPTQFKERMAAAHKDFWIASMWLGRGGPDEATASDYGRVGGHLRFEYSKLDRFVDDIVAGNMTPARIAWRAGLYAGGTSVAFHDGERQAKVSAGLTEERRYTTPAEHCDDCLAYAAMGWQPIGTLPVIGAGSQCLHNCQCRMVYR